MNAPKTALLAKFSNATEAEIARADLESAGIAVFIDSSASNMTLSHIGAAMGGVRLSVPEDALDAAKQILNLAQQPGGDQWCCKRCNEVHEDSFEVCWNCHGTRQEFESSPPSLPNDLQLSLSQKSSNAANLETVGTIESAWRAAVIGIVAPPFSLALNFYSLFQLAKVAPAIAQVALPVRRKFFYSTVANILVLAFPALGFWVLLGSHLFRY